MKKKTPGGQPSTDEDVLAELAHDYPLPKILLEYRGIAKLKSTYTDKLPRMVNADTGRVHTTYSQAVAVTGRLSSNDPNLQNIPIRTPQGRRIREAFIAPPGRKIISADYSQIELRIMAHLSGDEGLRHAFAHGSTCTRPRPKRSACRSTRSPRTRRRRGVNFGLIYGDARSGSRRTRFERATAQAIRFLLALSGREALHGRRAKSAHPGCVETVSAGAWLPEIKSSIPRAARALGGRRSTPQWWAPLPTRSSWR